MDYSDAIDNVSQKVVDLRNYFRHRRQAYLAGEGMDRPWDDILEHAKERVRDALEHVSYNDAETFWGVDIEGYRIFETVRHLHMGTHFDAEVIHDWRRPK